MKTALAAVAVALAAPATLAGPAAEGRALAGAWCAPCHAVWEGQTVAADAARPFPAIAADPTTTDAGLRAAMLTPHPPMPDPGLSEPDFARILAFIHSLKP